MERQNEAPEGDEVFDAEEFRSNVKKDRLMLELIGYFEEDARRMMAELERSGAAADLEAMRRATHGLKGLVGTCSGKKALSSAGAIDEMIRSGDLRQARERIPDLKREVDRLTKSLCDFRDSLEGQ